MEPFFVASEYLNPNYAAVTIYLDGGRGRVLDSDIPQPTAKSVSDGWWVLGGPAPLKFTGSTSMGGLPSWCAGQPDYYWTDVAQNSAGTFLLGHNSPTSSRVCLPDGGLRDHSGDLWESLYVTESGTIFVGTTTGYVLQVDSTVDGGVVTQMTSGLAPMFAGQGNRVWMTGTCASIGFDYSPISVLLEDGGFVSFTSPTCANDLSLVSPDEVFVGAWYDSERLVRVRLDAGASVLTQSVPRHVNQLLVTPEQVLVVGGRFSAAEASAQVYRRRGH